MKTDRKQMDGSNSLQKDNSRDGRTNTATLTVVFSVVVLILGSAVSKRFAASVVDTTVSVVLAASTVISGPFVVTSSRVAMDLVTLGIALLDMNGCVLPDHWLSSPLSGSLKPNRGCVSDGRDI